MDLSKWMITRIQLRDNKSFVRVVVRPKRHRSATGCRPLQFHPCLLLFSLSPIVISKSFVGYRISFLFFFSAADLSLSSFAFCAFSCASRSRHSATGISTSHAYKVCTTDSTHLSCSYSPPPQRRPSFGSLSGGALLVLPRLLPLVDLPLLQILNSNPRLLWHDSVGPIPHRDHCFHNPLRGNGRLAIYTLADKPPKYGLRERQAVSASSCTRHQHEIHIHEGRLGSVPHVRAAHVHQTATALRRLV